jgi:hypothetical protein
MGFPMPFLLVLDLTRPCEAVQGTS